MLCLECSGKKNDCIVVTSLDQFMRKTDSSMFYGQTIILFLVNSSEILTRSQTSCPLLEDLWAILLLSVYLPNCIQNWYKQSSPVIQQWSMYEHFKGKRKKINYLYSQNTQNWCFGQMVPVEANGLRDVLCSKRVRFCRKTKNVWGQNLYSHLKLHSASYTNGQLAAAIQNYKVQF